MSFWKSVGKVLVATAKNVLDSLADQSLIGLYRRSTTNLGEEDVATIATAQVAFAFMSGRFLPLVQAFGMYVAAVQPIAESDTIEQRLPRIADALTALPVATFEATLAPWMPDMLHATLMDLTKERVGHFSFSKRDAAVPYRALKQQFNARRRTIVEETVGSIGSIVDHMVISLEALSRSEQNVIARWKIHSVDERDDVQTITGLGAFIGSLIAGPAGWLLGGGLGALFAGNARATSLQALWNDLIAHLENVDRTYIFFLSFADSLVEEHQMLLYRLAYEELTFFDKCAAIAPIPPAETAEYWTRTLISHEASAQRFLATPVYPTGPTYEQMLGGFFGELRRNGVVTRSQAVLARMPARQPNLAGQGPSQQAAAPAVGGTDQEAYEILGLVPPATAETIRTAYRDKARRFHPDTIRSLDLDPSFTRFAEEQFGKLTDARNLLLERVQ